MAYDPAFVGAIAVLQSTFPVMPLPDKLASFVEAGLERLPGVERAHLVLLPEPIPPDSTPPGTPDAVWLDTLEGRLGWIRLTLLDPEAFAPYAPYVSNLANAIALHVHAVRQREKQERLLEQVQQLNRELEATAAARAREAEMNAELYQRERQAVRDREHLLSIVSHDLRNPLSAVRLGLEVLERRLGQEDASALGPRVRRIRDSVDQMGRLIEDLLDFARITSGKLTVEKLPGCIAALVSDAVELNGPLAQEKGVTLVNAGAPELVAPIDRARILQVLNNLIGNAIKFTPPAGRIEVAASAGPGEVVLTVRDTGPGIDPQLLPNIFDPYVQAERRSLQGLGLGLTITRSLVEAHNGRIWVQSTPGQGTTVGFTLPLS